MEDKVGFGFRPNDEELVGHYLRNKIEGNSSHVEVAISEVNICSYDPWDLRFQSKYKSRDAMWYFFSCRVNKYGNGNRQSRTTVSGKWKLTGESVEVKDQWGIASGVRGKIGHKRVLVFLDARFPDKTKSDWVIHEFHYDLLPEHKRTYVICRLEYKGDDPDILSAYAIDPTPAFAPNMANSEGSVVNQSRQGNSESYNTYSEYDSANRGQQFNMQQSVQGNSGYYNPFPEYDLANNGQWLSDYFNLQQQVPYSAPYDENSELIRNFVIEETRERTSMQEHYSDHQPKKPVTGVLGDDSSDNDSMTFGDTSSSTDSGCSSNESYYTPLDDDVPSLNTVVEPLHNYEAQEQPKQLKLPCQSKEKVINTQKSECEWKMAEDSIKKPPSTNTVKQSWIVLEKRGQRNAQWNYLINMIVGVLLFISIIGSMILVG
ncbi:PREDICTED: NAC domain-containing protein 1-like [Camelina sativa]|uniref:NAC domain-containing protein 1-like n=1 Tax=Camelina sativa TaxID=90675 RepID=A0ABM0VJI6_CAMSA|nr:PREDICTED: NAC domain-containing protein 1-like [Camelina sativa]